jgi:uncharacterized delta-60 repeat protein
MRNTTIVVFSAFALLGCDSAPPPGADGTSEDGQSGGLSATSTTGAAEAPGSSSDDTIGATSVHPSATSTGSDGETTDDPTGEVLLDLGTPPTRQACDWLLTPDDPGPKLLWCNELIPANADGASGNRVAVGPAGEIYVTGRGLVGSFDTDSEHGLLARYTPEGERLWSHAFTHGTLGFDDAWGVAVAPGGDVVVAGIAAHGAFQEHGWLARLSPDGVPVWDLDQPDMGYPRRIAAHVDGTFVVSGGEPYIGPAEPPVRISHHASDGALQWLYAPAGTLMYSENTGRSVAFDAAGSVYVAGTLSDRARFVAKLEPDGSVVWEHVVPPIDPFNWNYAEDLVVTPAGDVFVSGTVEDEAWMTRLTTDGVEVWSDFSALPDHKARFDALVQLPDGDLVVAGGQSDPDYAHTLWLRRYTPDGAVVWDWFLPDPSLIGITMDDLAVTPEGDVVVVGTSYDWDVAYLWLARLQP